MDEKDKKARILIVDDDESSRRSLSLVLGKNGYEAETAGTGQEALKKAQKSFFNLAFLDIRLPDVDGTKLIAPLKEMHPSLAVIMITGYASVETAVQALTDGASAYVTKPLNMDEVLTNVGGLLEKQRLIEDKERAEEALRENEEKYRELVENVSDVIYAVDESGVTTYISPIVESVLGYSASDLVGRSFAEFMHPEDLQYATEGFLSTLSGNSTTGEYRLLTKSGEIRWMRTSNRSMFKENRVIGATGVLTDITERKRAEEALRKSEEHYRLLAENVTDVIWTIDMNLQFTYVSPSVTRQSGYSVEEAMAKSVEENLTPASFKNVMKVFEEEMAIEKMEQKDLSRSRTLEVELYRKDGSTIWTELEVTFLRDSDGQAVGLLGVSRDITVRKRAEEKIEHLNTVLRAIRNVNQLITREKDSKRLIKGACNELVETRGYLNAWIAMLDESSRLVNTAEAGLGKHFKPMVDMMKRGELTDCGRRALNQSGVIIIEDQLSTCVHCPLAQKYGDCGAMTVRLEHDGKVYGFMSVSIPRDLTADEEEQALFREVAGDIAFALHNIKLEEERKRAEEDLRRLGWAVEATSDGVGIADVTSRSIYHNKALVEMLGYSSEELNAAGGPPAVYADPSVAREMFDAIQKGGSWAGEVQMKTRAGREVTVFLRANSIKNTEGTIIGLVGLHTDITERKLAEEELIRLSNAVRMANDSIVISDLEAKIIEVNEATLKMYGTDDKGYLIGKNSYDLIAPEDQEKAIASAIEVLERGYVENQEYHIITKDGSTVLVAMNVAIMKDVDGKPTGFVAVSRDITERKRMEEKLIELSITDDLTGLYNRRRFYEVLDAEINRTQRYGGSFSLVMLDLDRFKAYNDRFGHASGDAVLKSFANALQSTLRKTDTAFRYGGDEFTIIMPATHATRVKQIIERVRSKWLPMLEAQFTSLETPLGFSTGIAQCPENAETADGLVFLADTALYHAKRGGGYRSMLVFDLETPSAGTLSVATLDQVYALAATVDAKDPHTYGHAKAIAALSETIGKAIGLQEKELTDLRAASLLHDIGKVGVPDAILTKPGALTKEELEIIKKHPAEGARIVGYARELAALVPMIRHHHEWYDGTGYPDGLKGEEIPLGARIICVADAYDTMTMSRTYREVISHEEALEELRRCAGTQFDPEMVEAFCRLMNEDNRQNVSRALDKINKL